MTLEFKDITGELDSQKSLVEAMRVMNELIFEASKKLDPKLMDYMTSMRTLRWALKYHDKLKELEGK